MTNKIEIIESSIEYLFSRWESIIRNKASEYEHEARTNRKIVSSPSLDDICNEMNAFLVGITSGENK